MTMTVCKSILPLSYLGNCWEFRKSAKEDYHPQTTKGVCSNQSSKLSQANRMSNEQSTRDIDI